MLVTNGSELNKSLQVSRDCVSFINSLFSQGVATRAATESVVGPHSFVRNRYES